MDIKPLAKTPLINNADKATWNWFVELGNRINQLISKANSAIPAHKLTHATGGSDELTPADIGAASKTQDVWQVPTLLNSWVNYGNPFSPAGYFKDSLGMVHVRGMVKNGAAGSTIFTLPVGYRPSYTVSATNTGGGGAFGVFYVDNGGNVSWVTGGTNAAVCLDSIYFRAEA